MKRVPFLILVLLGAMCIAGVALWLPDRSKADNDVVHNVTLVLDWEKYLRCLPAQTAARQSPRSHDLHLTLEVGQAQSAISDLFVYVASGKGMRRPSGEAGTLLVKTESGMVYEYQILPGELIAYLANPTTYIPEVVLPEDGNSFPRYQMSSSITRPLGVLLRENEDAEVFLIAAHEATHRDEGQKGGHPDF